MKKKVIFAIVNKLLMYYMLLEGEGKGNKYNNEIKSSDEKFISRRVAIDRLNIYTHSKPVFAACFLIFFFLIGIHRYLIQSKGTSVIQNNVCK